MIDTPKPAPLRLPEMYESPYEWLADKIGRATLAELQEIARILMGVIHEDVLTGLFESKIEDEGYSFGMHKDGYYCYMMKRPHASKRS